MKSKDKARHHIGKAESHQLMVHNIQGLMNLQKYSVLEAANKFDVSEDFVSEIMETRPFDLDEKNDFVNDISQFGFEDQVERIDDGNSSERYAVFNITSFDGTDVRTGTLVSNVKGTPTNSPMMEFSHEGLTVKQSGFYLLRIVSNDGPFAVDINFPYGRMQYRVVTTGWLEEGDVFEFRIEKQDKKYLVGLQLRVQRV